MSSGNQNLPANTLEQAMLATRAEYTAHVGRIERAMTSEMAVIKADQLTTNQKMAELVTKGANLENNMSAMRDEFRDKFSEITQALLELKQTSMPPDQWELQFVGDVACAKGLVGKRQGGSVVQSVFARNFAVHQVAEKIKASADEAVQALNAAAVVNKLWDWPSLATAAEAAEAAKMADGDNSGSGSDSEGWDNGKRRKGGDGKKTKSSGAGGSAGVKCYTCGEVLGNNDALKKHKGTKECNEKARAKLQARLAALGN
ncbi:hypothetical protein HXX76_005578 [Chlamydomonas incerta]|uniref:Uncharacterized protein n=1 Tax=Chlamydomonas incerta TaxID=51695 RepID=A0A835T365_CHLIN|nr:hypothetical protein HXX76_005578 [Chlamydomonas incerta]|eukprot:KAG2437963.1 hypothetical protein HXX76_005578 [Chlamydomonas incerta]